MLLQQYKFRILLYGLVLFPFAARESAYAEQRGDRLNLSRDVGIEQRLNTQIPLNLQFRDETGRAVQLQDYFGEQPVILTLVYYRCPMLCGLELKGLVRALRVLEWSAGREFRVVTVSIDPQEGPQVAAPKRRSYLKQYSRSGAEHGWHFLTGEADEIRQLTRAVGFRYVESSESGQFAHAAGLIVLTPQGRTSRYFYGVDFAPRDLRLALVEASDNQIGTLTDQVMLFCYLYDPATGKYTLSILRLLRVAGIGTVATMAAGIFVMLRKERKPPSSPVQVPHEQLPPSRSN